MMIKDQFTNLKVSRQRKYQLRKQLAGRCIVCTDPREEDSVYCSHHREVHRDYAREYARTVQGCIPKATSGKGRNLK